MLKRGIEFIREYLALALGVCAFALIVIAALWTIWFVASRLANLGV